MQKETRSLSALKIQENVLLKRADRQNYVTAKNTLAQAQRQAKKIVSDAYQEADSVRQSSYCAGYERGLLMAIEAVTLFIDNRHLLVNNLYLQLRNDVRALLTDAVSRESVITALFENWAESIDNKEDSSPLYILLPLSRRHYKKKMMAFIERTHQGNAIFEFHQDSHYVFKYREQLVEFSPELFVENQADVLLANKDLYSECEKVSADALHRLHDYINQYLPRPETFEPTENTLEREERCDSN